MKATLYDIKGAKKGEITLPALFDSKVRGDLVQKSYEAFKFASMQPYFSYAEAGKRHSASGTISHQRHKWKGHYGKGISRAPRKTMWRRGTQFFWVGAEVSGARGGRRAHPPKPNYIRKINKKERILAFNSVLAATAHDKYISSRYSTLVKSDLKFPVILESTDFSKIKSKELILALKNILGKVFPLALKKKSVRPGKGKMRGRKYKSNAGILIVTSNSEDLKMKGLDIKQVNELRIQDFYPLGRLTIFTEKSLQELGASK